VAVHRLDRATARRIAVRAQLLSAERPADLLTVVHRLTFLQLDPTAAVAPSADLVAYTRLGRTYRPEQVKLALERDRTLFEHRAMIRPMTDLALYRPAMAEWEDATDRHREWLAANDAFRRYVLDLLRGSGPLMSRDIPDRSTVPWPSTGWTNNRNVTQMLQFLAARGELAISGRSGRQRLWDLAERVYPDTELLPAAEARRRRNERRLGSLGIARSGMVGEAGEPAEVEGTRGSWRVDPAGLGQPFAGRTALLSPFDRLVHDRVRTLALFEFDYVLEMYAPKAKRRWGYFALPVLHGDRLVGKVDATADHKAGVLRVDAVHEDEPFSVGTSAAVQDELDTLAGWLGLTQRSPAAR
jgi:uncharacterized protein YcaQ